MAQQREIGTYPIGPPPSPTNQFGNPATFTAAANTQASDYDKIMAQYDDLAKSASSNPITAAPIAPTNAGAPGMVSASPVSFKAVSPQTTNYTQSGDVTKSLSDLSNLVDTGGYSAADIADIRARDISPIRSIYSNAQQNVERQKALAGGYSPSFNATQAKMARDESSQIGDVTTNANAGIAQNVASNKIAAASPYASASASANAAKTAADLANANIVNQANEFNSSGSIQADEFNSGQATQAGEFNSSVGAANAEANANRATSTTEFNTQEALDAAKANRSLTTSALAGKTNLYGTTPALVNTFGNQVMQAGQMGRNQQQINNQRQTQIFGRAGGF